MNDYLRGLLQFKNPTQKKALRNILRSLKAKESPSIMDFEEIGALRTDGRIKTDFKLIFDELGINYEAFK